MPYHMYIVISKLSSSRLIQWHGAAIVESNMAAAAITISAAVRIKQCRRELSLKCCGGGGWRRLSAAAHSRRANKVRERTNYHQTCNLTHPRPTFWP